MKPNRCTDFLNLFWNKTLHVSDSSSVHYQEFFTAHTAMVYGIRTSWSYSQAVNKLVWHIPLLCVQWKTPDYGHRNCPKMQSFIPKINFEKLVHLVGFIIRICHKARSLERQITSTLLRAKSEISTAPWYNDLQSNFGLGIFAWTQNIQYIKNFYECFLFFVYC